MTSIQVVGKIVEVGRLHALNEVVLEVGEAEIRVQGVSDTLMKWLAHHLYEEVELSFRCERETGS